MGEAQGQRRIPPYSEGYKDLIRRIQSVDKNYMLTGTILSRHIRDKGESPCH